MSGIGAACSAAKPRTPILPFRVSMDWTGAVTVNVSGASGSTSGSNRFVHQVSGGVQPVADGFNVTYNPSGKLGVTTIGVGLGVSWSGLAVGESAPITVQYYGTDAAGSSDSAADSTVIHRVS